MKNLIENLCLTIQTTDEVKKCWNMFFKNESSIGPQICFGNSLGPCKWSPQIYNWKILMKKKKIFMINHYLEYRHLIFPPPHFWYRQFLFDWDKKFWGKILELIGALGHKSAGIRQKSTIEISKIRFCDLCRAIWVTLCFQQWISL